MGIMDYFNAVMVDYGAFELMYGVSKCIVIALLGVAPHVYIPWTPEHLKREVGLDDVLNCIKSASI